MASRLRMNCIRCVVVVVLSVVVRAQDLHRPAVYRSQHHHTGGQAGAQAHQVSSSGGQGGYSSSSSSYSSSSGQRGGFVSSDGLPYYQYRPHVSSGGGTGRSVVASGTGGNRQTYDYPFGRGQINYVSSETHRSTDLHGRAGISSSNSGNRTGNSNSNSTHGSSSSSTHGSSSSSSSSSGRDGVRTYAQQQQRRQYFSRGSSGFDSGANQRTGYATRSGGRANQGTVYPSGGANQRGGYRTGQVYNRYHLSGPNNTRSGQGQARGRHFTRTRYIPPGYGPSISQGSAHGPYVSQGSYGSGGYQRSARGQYVSQGSYGTVGNQRDARGPYVSQGSYGTGTYPRRTGRSQTTGGRTPTYRRNPIRSRNQVYVQGRVPSRATSRGGEECPDTGVELRLDGMSCDQAVRRHGLGLCYIHQFSSRGCCQACRPRRNPSKPGCEYGDRASQCSTIRPVDCYNAENRRICCQTCDRLRRTDTPGCEYGDRSNQCDAVRSNPGLCYNTDNRRMCCQSCAARRDNERPDCPWGDHNAHQCRPFETNSTRVRINCYSPRTRNLCCNSCRRLRDWVPDGLPAGCEYGDQPVTFLSPQVGQLTCSTYFQHFSAQHCTLPDSDVAHYCCFTCHRLLAQNPRRRG